MTPEEKAIEAMHEYADERISEAQGLYRMKAEALVGTINTYWKYAEDDEERGKKESADEWRARAIGIEEALVTLGFSVGYNTRSRRSYLA